MLHYKSFKTSSYFSEAKPNTKAICQIDETKLVNKREPAQNSKKAVFLSPHLLAVRDDVLRVLRLIVHEIVIGITVLAAHRRPSAVEILIQRLHVICVMHIVLRIHRSPVANPTRRRQNPKP